MAWQLGSVTNNYVKSVIIDLFLDSDRTVDYSTYQIAGGNINIVIPLVGTLSFKDTVNQGSGPPRALKVYFYEKEWSFPYDQTTKINVTIDARGVPTLQQV